MCPVKITNQFMKSKSDFCFPILLAASALSLCACESTGDNRPIPGTVESTNDKWDAAQNNTPRTNPTPNPEPASNPPGPN